MKPIETAPKDGTHILLCFPDWDHNQEPEVPTQVVIEGWWDKDMYPRGGWDVVALPSHGCGCCYESNQNPTLWMPLPEIPK